MKTNGGPSESDAEDLDESIIDDAVFRLRFPICTDFVLRRINKGEGELLPPMYEVGKPRPHIPVDNKLRRRIGRSSRQEGSDADTGTNGAFDGGS